MKLCLGTVQFGMNYGIQNAGQPKADSVYEILDLAYECGIDTLDTASAYGDAEDRLGVWLSMRDNCRHGIRIISKLKSGILEGTPKEKWRNAIATEAAKSLTGLGVDKLEAYLFHNAEHIFDERAVCALSAVVAEGLAKKIGVSIYTPKEAMQALSYDDIKVIQIPYNVFDHRLDKCGFFERAKEKNVEVYARSSLLQGLAVMKPEAIPVGVDFAKRYLVNYRTLCDEYGVTPLEAAVCYVGAHKGIDYVVFGVDNKFQLKEYVEMRDKKIPDELNKRLTREFMDVEERLVNPTLWNK